MGLLDKLKDKVVSGISTGVSNAVKNTAQRKTEEVVQGQVDKVADTIIKTAPKGEHSTTGLAGLAGIMNDYATTAVNEAAKNLKICPKCEEPCSADKKFCPSCGTALPEQTLAAVAVCTSCGKQNTIGEKFCSDCGAKLPYAEQEEQAAKIRDDEAMAKWSQFIPQYPIWHGGGHSFKLYECGLDSNNHPYYSFEAEGVDAVDLAKYRELAKENGFRQAGEYPTDEMLYKRIDGVVYGIETDDAFMRPGVLRITFTTSEPHGGFDYIKQEPTLEKKKGFFGLFKK